jgi:type IV pilus assembly protein PilY1
MQKPISRSAQSRITYALTSACYAMLICWSSNVAAAAGPAPPISISQVPLTVTIPAHPQILLALANSESMDGNLSGAIMTGSGSIGQPLLHSSASPVNFAIPTGFTPPINNGDGVNAPYTVNVSGVLVDNSPSRLNVAKAGLTAVLNAYIASADFGLIDYDVGGLTPFTTWVYQMSQPGGFTFVDTPGPTVPGVTEYVLNPCYGYTTAPASQATRNCANLAAFYPTRSISLHQYMVVSASSDDPSVNDVLYAGGFDPVCIVYGGPNHPTPFPPYFSLGSYEGGGVSESYGPEINSCAGTTGPTNAGFVPYSNQVMY